MARRIRESGGEIKDECDPSLTGREGTKRTLLFFAILFA